MLSQQKDAPAFDFYPERWLAGVAELSDIEQLSFLRLLCHQWIKQGLPEAPEKLRRLAGKGVTADLLVKFPLGEDGLRRNARLEIVRSEQRARIAKKSEQRKAAANARWAKPQCGTDATASPPHVLPQCGSNAHHPPPTTHPSKQQQQHAGATPEPAAAAAEAGSLTRLHPHCTQLEAEQWADRHNRNTMTGVRITPEIAVSWWEDRTRSDWHYGKNGTLIPLTTCQQVETDIVSYARSWAKNEFQKPQTHAQKRAEREIPTSVDATKLPRL